MKTYINYTEYLKKENNLRALEKRGIQLYFEKNKAKLFVGIVCIGIGIITIPIPFTTIPLLSLGFYLLGLGTADLFRIKELIRRRIRRKLL